MTRFFVALLTPPAVTDFAMEVIGQLGDRHQTHTAKAPPHITLQAPFEWKIQDIQRVEAGLAQFAQAHSPIPIQLSGFGSFPPHVLYIQVLKTSGLMNLQSDLPQTLDPELGIVDPKIRQRGFTPHVTVASRNLTRQTFGLVWEALQGFEQIEVEFWSDRLTLLQHDGQQWQIRREFSFDQSQQNLIGD
ncbi:MAG: 2'-5' RNA ligase family protein [Oculatellaceae cyanobacterium Prado106]|jgi:2'-5' RNA ligase|nr:2'-5' RNA ligase family protein [Oculatellaceae cyanobacterium Prado106]